MTLQEIITHIIIDDTNRKECAFARAKTLFAKEMWLKTNLLQEGTKKKLGHKKKNKIEIPVPMDLNPPLRKRVIASYMGS